MKRSWMRAALWVGLASSAALACEEDEPTTAEDVVVDGAEDTVAETSSDMAEADTSTPLCEALSLSASTVSVGAWSVTLEEDGGWSVQNPSGEAVLSGPPPCVEGAEGGLPAARYGVGDPRVDLLFGAFRVNLEISSMDWTPVDGDAPALVEDAGEATLRWSAGEGELGLRFATRGEDLSIALEGAEADAGEISMDCEEGEAFFGLGTQTTGMDLRPGYYPLWTQEQGIGKTTNSFGFPLKGLPGSAYAPMGVLYSTRGYTAVIGHDAYSEYDLCEAVSDRVLLRSHAAMPSFVLVAGETPAERLSALTESYTGRLQQAPASWVLAPWNDSVGGEDRLFALASALRDNGIPSSAIWAEDWIGGLQTSQGYRLSYAWAWDPQTYPNLPTNIEALHADGFAFLAYFNTFVPEPTAMWDEGVAGGYLVENDEGEVYSFQDPASRNAALVDLTNPDAVDWFRGYMTTAAETLEIDGWMADFSEWLPHDAVLFDGTTGWETHNRYPLLFQALVTEVMTTVHEADAEEADNNWTFFARSGWASVNGGSAETAATMWGGDQNTDFMYDDGFPTVLPLGAHVGLAGVAIFGTDIAGYSSFITENTDKELFYRWSSLGPFQGLMRTHHGSDKCGNWTFDRDAETLEHYRRYARIRTLLLPYIEGLVDDALNRGWPMIRHPYLVEPETPAMWQGLDYQLFFGDALLVAPVLEEGALSREVVLPGPGWWPLFGDTPVAEEGAVEVDAPMTEIPIFVRPGTILPLFAEVVDSFYGATAEGITDLEDVAGRYRLALYPDAAGGLSEVGVGEAVVSGEGFSGVVDWTAASLDGGATALPACEGVAEGVSCASAEGVTLVGSELTLTVGDATLTITSAAEQSYAVAMAGAAWGELGQPTTLTVVDPDIPPPCQEEGTP